MNIIVELQGGLGNQMFQYAFGKEISQLTNRNLILDLSTLNKDYKDIVKRDFDLTIFNLSDVTVVNSFGEDYYKVSELTSPNLWNVNYYETIKKEIINYNHNNLYLEGYWQSPILFSEKFNTIKEFSFKNPILKNSKDIFNEIKNTNSVMINIRRKDFVNNDFHGWYGIDFIMKSIKSLESKENDLHFFVFSDDIDWCKNNLNFLKNHTLVDHTHSGYKFGNYIQLMTECKHFIVPNSTFAFWASFLSKNKNKKIIRPKIWFKYNNLECDFLFETLNYEKIDCMFH